MDGLFQLFCGCCGMGADPEPPYNQLRHDSVTPVRDPPLPYVNGHQQPHLPPHHQGFINPVHDFDSPDAPHPYAQAPRPHGNLNESPSPPPSGADFEEVFEDTSKEKELLDNIVESTQHSIIAVGQTDCDGLIMHDMHHRELAYKRATQKLVAVGNPAVKTNGLRYDFDFEQRTAAIAVPIRYDEMSSTIEQKQVDRMPFSCPDFNQIKLARPMGQKQPIFLVEHPDPKKAGRSSACTALMRAKINEVLDDVHSGVMQVEVEPRDLIVNMDF